MPRFYMHVLNGDGWTRDKEGVELADLAAALGEALKGARDLMASEVQAGTLDLSALIAIGDERGREVHRLLFSDALTVTGLPGRG